VKPNNVLVNYADDSRQQITEVQLADFGSTVSEKSGHAKDGDDISTPMFRSPEAQMQLPWTTATDIWSFGVTARSHSCGRDKNLLTDIRCSSSTLSTAVASTS